MKNMQVHVTWIKCPVKYIYMDQSSNKDIYKNNVKEVSRLIQDYEHLKY